MKTTTLLFVVIIISTSTGCKDPEAEARERERLKAEVAAEVIKANEAKEAEAKRVAEEKRLAAQRDLVANPNNYLSVTDLIYVDKGIINSYRDVTSVSVRNGSDFTVERLSGNIEWSNAAGAPLGSVPISLKGSIASGATASFATSAGTLTTGTLAGAGSTYKLKWTNVSISGEAKAASGSNHAVDPLACKSRQAEARGNLLALLVAQEGFYAEAGAYGRDLAAINFKPAGEQPRYRYGIVSANAASFTATAIGEGEMAGDEWQISSGSKPVNTKDRCTR